MVLAQAEDFFSFVTFPNDLPGSLLESISSGNAVLFSKVFPHVYLLGSAHVLPTEMGDCPENQRKEALHSILGPQQGLGCVTPLSLILWFSQQAAELEQRIFAFLALSLIQKGSQGWREMQISEVLSTEDCPPKHPGSESVGRKEQTDGLYRWGSGENEN